jgi:hypothetical protein
MPESTSSWRVPTADPIDVRDCWTFAVRHPNGATGAGGGLPKVWAGYRAGMLRILSMMPDDPLAPWRRDENDLDDVVFRVAAVFPMDWIGEGIYSGLPFDSDAFLARLRQ